MEPTLLALYQALQPIINSQSIRNLKRRYENSLSTEGVEDALCAVTERIYSKDNAKQAFWTATDRTAWFYTALQNQVLTDLRKEEIRDPEKLQALLSRLHDELRELQARQIDMKEPLADEIEKIEDAIRKLINIQNGVYDEIEPDIPPLPDTGCPARCMEKLAREHPNWFTVFLLKKTNKRPKEIARVLNRIHGPQMNQTLLQNLERLEIECAQIDMATLTEGNISQLLGAALGFTVGTINNYTTNASDALERCVTQCEENERK